MNQKILSHGEHRGRGVHFFSLRGLGDLCGYFPSFILAIALMIAAELGTRLFFGETMSGRFEYGYHPTAGFVEKGDTIHLVRAGGRRFYPQTFQRAPAKGVFRIFVIGDSVPRGPSLKKAYLHDVEEQLRSMGRPTESVNLSVPGFGSHRDFVALQKAVEYHPDLVILHMNNSNEFEDTREYLRMKEFQGWHPRNWLMKSLVIRRLNEVVTEKCYWAWLPLEIRLPVAANDADARVLASIQKDPEILKKWDQQVKDYTAKSVALARQHGAKVLLISQACSEKDPEGKPFLNDHGLDALAASFEGEGVYHLSMKKVLQPLKFASLFSDAAHLYWPGHKILANAIVKFLEEKKVISSSRKLK